LCAFGVLVVVAAAGKLLLFLPIKVAVLAVAAALTLRNGFMQVYCQPLFQ
jgi:hypothetical protein